MNIHGSKIDFPFRVGITGTLVTTADRSEQIVQAIADVIETRTLERAMMPDYGLKDFIFAVQNSAFAQRLAYHLEMQIRKYVPLVKNVQIKAATDEDGRAIVNIKYEEVGTFSSPKNLVYPVWRLLIYGD